MKTNKTALLFLMLTGFSIGYAQQGSVAAGGDANSASGSISYSIGQISYTNITNGTYSIQQGVQQPYEISVVTGLASSEIKVEMAVYPNPTVSDIHLTIENFTNAPKTYFKLFDATGKLIVERQIDKQVTEVQIHEQAAGVYFLEVFLGNHLTKTFRVVKN